LKRKKQEKGKEKIEDLELYNKRGSLTRLRKK